MAKNLSLNLPLPAWSHWIVAPLLGVLATSGFAPFGYWPLTLLALAGLFWLSSAQTPRRALLVGWLFGLGHFASGIYWIYISTHIYGGAPAWLGVVLCVVLFSYMALYPALVVWLTSRCGWWRGHYGWLGVPALWLLGELLRGWIYSGFPWLSLGYIAVDMPLERAAPLVGVYGLSAWLVLSAYGLFRAVDAGALGRPLALILALSPMAALLLPAPDHWTQDKGNPLRVAIIQGNVPQDEKWDRDMGPNILQRYRDMTLAAAQDADLVVWPESVPNRLYREVIPYFEMLSKHLVLDGSTLLAGVLIYDRSQDHMFNTMLAMGTNSGRYDKHHLVPFGEYFPIPSWLRPIMDVLGTPYSDFTPGDTHYPPIKVKGEAIGVSICFEDVFGNELRHSAAVSSLLVNATNDAWFAKSSAPWQHLEITRMRALETGRWIVRATNTGISAIIDPDGRTVSRSGLFTTEILKGGVPARAGLTPYVRHGDTPLWVLALALVLGGAAFSWQRGRALRAASAA